MYQNGRLYVPIKRRAVSPKWNNTEIIRSTCPFVRCIRARHVSKASKIPVTARKHAFVCDYYFYLTARNREKRPAVRGVILYVFVLFASNRNGAWLRTYVSSLTQSAVWITPKNAVNTKYAHEPVWLPGGLYRNTYSDRREMSRKNNEKKSAVDKLRTTNVARFERTA